jgi:hypothetical protein
MREVVDSGGRREQITQPSIINQEPAVNHPFAYSPNNRRPVASVTPMDPNVNAKRGPTQRTNDTLAAAEQTKEHPRKRVAPNASWNQTKRKQQRSQQRAFTNRKDNPFAFFQHDPNDAESFLEGLSVSNTSKSSLIPQQELEALSRKTVPRVPRVSQARGMQKGRANPKRRRHFSSYQKISDKELLQQKAAEQASYAAANVSYASPLPLHQSPGAFSMDPTWQSGLRHESLNCLGPGNVAGHGLVYTDVEGDEGHFRSPMYTDVEGAEGHFKSPMSQPLHPFQQYPDSLEQIPQWHPDMMQRQPQPPGYFQGAFAPSFPEHASTQSWNGGYNAIPREQSAAYGPGLAYPEAFQHPQSLEPFSGEQMTQGSRIGPDGSPPALSRVHDSHEAEITHGVPSRMVDQHTSDSYFNDVFF